MIQLPSRGPSQITPDEALAQEYLAEYRGRTVAIRQDLLNIAKTPQSNDELENSVFRAVHSVRGAVFFGWAKVGELAHQMENVLALVRSRKLGLNSYRVGILLLATDRLEQLLQCPGLSNEADIGRIVAALERVAPYPSPREAPSHDIGQVRFLVAEDDLSSRLLLKSFLSRYGECDVSINGAEAVAAVRAAFQRRQKYHLICMDLRMPETGGREAVRQVRALEEAAGISPDAGAKIVVLTAIDDTKEMIGCFEDFSDAYLIKPINLVNLLRHLKSWQLAH